MPPRPDFRKLAASRLGTPEPIVARVGALLGMTPAEMEAAALAAATPVMTAPVSARVVAPDPAPVAQPVIPARAVFPAGPIVSGPSPVGDLAARSAAVVAPRRAEAIDLFADQGDDVPDADTLRERAISAFGAELARLVDVIGGPDGRPAEEHDRARVRKFLQIARIYLDNLAVRMK